MGYQDLRIRKNMTLGLQWEVVWQPLRFEICLRPVGKRKVSIILPDGSMQRFEAANDPECATAQVPGLNVVYHPLAGTTAKLEVADPGSVLIQGGQLYDTDSFGPWNPKDYTLTTQDGFIYHLREGVGVLDVKDPWGNTLTYSDNGILHSNGQSVAFTRDAQGHITAVTDPAGNSLHYQYDALGNLTGMSDRLGDASRFTYNGEHGLTSYTDPRGITLAKQIYDDQGRLIATVDAEGKRTEITHDTAANQESVTDRLGRTSTYTYDAQGNVTRIVDPLGQVTTYAYDALGNETQVTDPLGHTTTKVYDPKTSQVLSETDPLGNTTASSYGDPLDPYILTQSTDALGHVTAYEYEGKAPSAIREPLGRTTALGYDGKGNLTLMAIAGLRTGYYYDQAGNRVQEHDALGHATSFAYDANNRQTSRTTTRTDANGQTRTLTSQTRYDAEGRVTQETDALGATTKTRYNAIGKPEQVTDPLGRNTTYSYDARARLIKTTYPDGSFDTTDYDAEGNKIAETDRGGHTTRYAYDGKNRLIKTTYPDGTSDTSQYDAAGRTEATHDALGNPVSNRYDAAGRLTASTDALGHTSSYTYDANGNRLTATDATGKTTTYTYDALNRLTQTTDPDGHSRSIAYRPDGRKERETDANGNSVRYAYDALGRIEQVTLTSDGIDAVTRFTYDEVGNKISQTDAEGRTTRWAYDDGGRPIQRTLPDGSVETTTYDLAGNRTTHTDFQGRTTSYGHDPVDRPTSETQGSAKTGTTYTPSGQVASRTDARGTTRYQYDARERLIRQDNPDGRYLAWGYDANGNLLERTSPAGTTRYTYDALNRIQSVAGIDGKQTSYQFDANGNLSQTTTPDGVTTNYTHDAQNRLTGIEHRKGQTLLASYAYTLAPDGKRLQKREDDAGGTLRTSDYAYDGQGRLLEEKTTERDATQNKTVRYRYDKVGNRTQKTETTASQSKTTRYSYDSNDRLTQTDDSQDGVTTYRWDQNGNLTRKQTQSETTLYAWDGHNRLIEVKRGPDEATASTLATYGYDADGNRIQKTEKTGQGDKVTHYLIDPTFPYAQAVEETTTENGQTETAYNLWGYGLIEQTRGGQGTYYHTDAQQSTTLLTDGAGQVTDTYAYGAFGEASHTGASTNAYRYTGEYYDDAAGLQYNRARWYDAQVGRWTGLDPYEGSPTRPLTLNKYAYSHNDPVNNSDPGGMFTLGEMMKGIDTAMTLASRVINIYDTFLAPEEDDDSERETVWDMIMAQVVSALGYGLSSDDGPGPGAGMVLQAAAAVASQGAKPEHHVIPKYLCGAGNQSPLVKLPRSDHNKLHSTLDRFSQMINYGGLVVSMSFSRKIRWKNLWKKTFVRRVARTKKGRGAIFEGLSVFYSTTVAPSGNLYVVDGLPPIGFALMRIGPKYVQNRQADTSWPLCM